jgi:hypothetical protein
MGRVRDRILEAARYLPPERPGTTDEGKRLSTGTWFGWWRGSSRTPTA